MEEEAPVMMAVLERADMIRAVGEGADRVQGERREVRRAGMKNPLGVERGLQRAGAEMVEERRGRGVETKAMADGVMEKLS